jgi:hypothetical protein
MNVEFAEAVYGKSGEGMAEVLYASFGDNINKTDVIETEKGDMVRTTSHVGLNIAHKVIAVCGDNAPNNDTFCDHFHRKLLAHDYDDDPQLDPNSSLKSCRFRGRKSRIRCLAHITSLIGDAVFDHLKAGTTKEAKELLQRVLNGDANGVFPTDCLTLSVYMKIRTFVLWIMASDEC